MKITNFAQLTLAELTTGKVTGRVDSQSENQVPKRAEDTDTKRKSYWTDENRFLQVVFILHLYFLSMWLHELLQGIINGSSFICWKPFGSARPIVLLE